MKKVTRTGKELVAEYRPLSIVDVWDELSREIWDSWSPFTLEDGLFPSTDLHEEKGQLVMKTELPGMDAKDLDITLDGDRLTIKAEKEGETKKGKSGDGRERSYQEYYHSVTLPYPVKEDKIKVKFERGVLELRLPREELKAKKIEIKTQLPRGETKKLEEKPGPSKS